MNKYKMIAMCSFSIVCVLILSLILPLTIDANDRESLEIKMHYKDSTVTTNIIVNSDIYTGVVCKYIELDDVLTEEDLPSKTQTEGATVNLDQTSKDNYEARIENVSKRYVVIYVSIGNCELCDYIDCNPSASKEQNNSEEDKDNNANKNEEDQSNATSNDSENQEDAQNNSEGQEKNSNTSSNENIANTENNTNNETSNNPIVENVQNNDTQSNDFQTIEEVQNNTNSNETQNSNNNSDVEQNSTDKNTENSNNADQNNTNQSNETSNSIEQNNTNQGTQTANNTQQNNEVINNQQNDYIPQAAGGAEPIVDDNSDVQNIIQAPSFDTVGTAQNNYTESAVQSNTNVANKNTYVSANKDSADMNGFQEIQSVEKTATANTGMPQTGENDSLKIMGIVVFSIISIVSFYKYKKER